MKKHWKQVTRQDLIKLCEKMTGPEIAEEFGVHSNAVYYKMQMHGIRASRKRSQKRFDPPKVELEELYKKMSMADIAEHYGVGETVVFMRLKQHGIGGITRSDRLSGKPKSLEHRLSMSKSAILSGVRSGSKNGNWKGGVNQERLTGRSKAAYHEWKAAVLTKSEWKCVTCGVEHGSICSCCGAKTILHAHHIKHFSLHPELRYEISNGIALCQRCHFDEHHK